MVGLFSTPPANPAIFNPPLVDTNPVEYAFVIDVNDEYAFPTKPPT
jgi:hypothetical protein